MELEVKRAEKVAALEQESAQKHLQRVHDETHAKMENLRKQEHLDCTRKTQERRR